MTKDIDKQETTEIERTDGNNNQDSGDVNASTESNTELQGNVSNTQDTSSNDRSRHADETQNNINQESNTTSEPEPSGEISNTGNSHALNNKDEEGLGLNVNMTNETENSANFDQSKSKLNEEMGNIIEKDKEGNNNNAKCEINSEDGRNKNETNMGKQEELLCPKEGEIQNEPCNKESGPGNNNIEEQLYSDAKCETLEGNTKEDEVIIQIFCETVPMEQKQGDNAASGNKTETVGNSTKDQHGMKQETRNSSEEELRLNNPTVATAQTNKEEVKENSKDEIYNLPTFDNTGDSSAPIQNGGDQEICNVTTNNRETSVPILEDNPGDVNNECVKPPPHIGDSSKPIETTGDENNCSDEKIIDPPTNIKENSTQIQNAGDIIDQKRPNAKENLEKMNTGDKNNQDVDPSPSSVCESTIYSRCTTRYCYCCCCCRLRWCNRCYCQSCCRPSEGSNAPCQSDCQNCSRPNDKPTASSVNEPSGLGGHSNCQNCSKPNNEPSTSVCDVSFHPKHTSSPLKSKSNEQNELEATPSKRRKLNEDPENRDDTGNKNTTSEDIHNRNREDENTKCEACRDRSNTRSETSERQRGYESGYCEQITRQNCRCRVCRPCSNRNYWANNKSTQTNEESIENPNEKSTQTCFADVTDEGRTFLDDTKVFGEQSWVADNKENPRQIGKNGKQSFDKQHYDDELLYRNDTQPPPLKKKRGNKDTGQYEQYHHNAYLNYYVRLFREERFQGVSANEVAKYAGYEWRSRMSEKEKRPYYDMRKLAPPRMKSKRKRRKYGPNLSGSQHPMCDMFDCHEISPKFDDY
ncbi:hypothetical protein WDU94_011097 [Cyamophila willieti]